MEQEKKPIVWIFHNGENSASMEHILNQGGFKCSAFTTNDDCNMSLEKTRPDLIITDSMQILTKARNLGITAVTPDKIVTKDYRQTIHTVSQIISKPEQSTQTGMNR